MNGDANVSVPPVVIPAPVAVAAPGIMSRVLNFIHVEKVKLTSLAETVGKDIVSGVVGIDSAIDAAAPTVEKLTSFAASITKQPALQLALATEEGVVAVWDEVTALVKAEAAGTLTPEQAWVQAKSLIATAEADWNKIFNSGA